MPSFDSINYSVRPNKTIERALAFDGMKRLTQALDLKNQLYIGMGSVWFSDFVLAHKQLGIADMISFEKNDIGHARACYNKPYRTVSVVHKTASEGIDELLTDADAMSRPWIVWLDYDSALTEEYASNIRDLIEGAPVNTMLLVTFSATSGAYGRPRSRALFLRNLFGNIVPTELAEEATQQFLPETLATFAVSHMNSAAVSCARPGSFLPAFRLIYTDTATMVTVGGVMPAAGARSTAIDVLRNRFWPGVRAKRIEAPHLTIREIGALQSSLPRPRKLKRADVRRLGFDLQELQISSYEEFYKLYPRFAEVII